MKESCEMIEKVIGNLEHDEKSKTIASIALVLLLFLAAYNVGEAVGKFLYYLIH